MSWIAYIFWGVVNQIQHIWSSAEATVILLSVIGALIGVRMANRVTKRRTTIEYLMRMNWDKDYIAARKAFAKIIKTPNGLVEAYDLIKQKPNSKIIAKMEEANTALLHVRVLLNNYELMAIGIREGILDEAIYRRWFQAGTVRDWEAVSELVARIRRDHRDSIFME